jgi:hypothetical protein
MKKFLIVLLSLGLIAAFSMTASAADVKFGGSYYVVGVYDNNDALADTSATHSRAFFYQRVRLQPVFQIAEGLTFTARMDALEKQWGNANWTGSADTTSSRRETASVGNPKIQESFEFEQGYVTFLTSIGQFQVGYQDADAFGTAFADNTITRPRIMYITQVGSLTLLAVYDKAFEADTSSLAGYSRLVSADNDIYYLAGIYGFPGGNAGLLYGYIDFAESRPAGYRTKWQVLVPYVKAQFGPVYVESEVFWTFGKTLAWDNAPAGYKDMDKNGWDAYLMAKANLGPAYVGAQVGWSQGDNDATDNTDNTGWGGGTDWNPALILMNDELNTWKAGGNNTTVPGGITTTKYNMILYNIFGGFNPTPKINVQAALTYAQADKTPAGYVSKKMGTEFDMTATYKIYDNLSYMVGAGFLSTGDYFKGTNPANNIGNDYLLMNKLSLSF